MSRVAELVMGYQQTCVLIATIKAGVIDCLAEGPRTVALLSRELGLHAPTLGRLLRALEILGMVSSTDDNWSLTRSGGLLRKDGLGAGIRSWAELVGGEYLAAWGHLSYCLKTGLAAFPEVFGQPVWEHRQNNPDLNESFQNLTRGEQLRAGALLTRSLDLSGVSTVVDVGGGHGHLIAILLRKHPEMSGILFDLPHVVSGAASVLREAEVDQRCSVVAGSFHETVPAGADLYILKHILHNWEDSDCRCLLERCAQAMTPTSRLLVLENVIPESSANSRADLRLAMMDLHMLAVLGGRERNEAEYRALLAGVGLRLERRHEGSGCDILETTLEVTR